MKTFTFSVISALSLLFTFASTSPLPQSGPAVVFDGHASAVVLKLNDGSVTRCTLASQPSRAKADLVSSKLVASGKMACSDSREHKLGGKTLFCQSGQLVSVEEAMQTLNDACQDHAGVHSMEV